MIGFTPPIASKEFAQSLSDWENNMSSDSFAMGQINLSTENGFWADDIYLRIEEHGWEKRVIFKFETTTAGLSDHHIEEQNKKFHLAGFFGRLAYRDASMPELKKYYNLLAEALSNPDIQTIPDYQMPDRTSFIDRIYTVGRKIVRRLRLMTSSQPKGNETSAASHAPLHKNEARLDNPAHWAHVLITGWYGTETSGDKAILGEIIYRLRTYHPSLKITVTTIDERVSRQTHFEMGLKEVKTIPIYLAADQLENQAFDAVIMGGGPLMESRQIVHIRNIFKQANVLKIARILFGCGVGPIHTLEMKQMIGEICGLTTAGFFRDEASRKYAQSLSAATDLPVACDPAIAYIARWRREHKPDVSCFENLSLTCLLREQTREYDERGATKDRLHKFVLDINEILKEYRSQNPHAIIQLMPMHMYWKGNDDRLFNRRLSAVSGEIDVHCVRAYWDINTFLNHLSKSSVAMVMRYHGHLFCMALGIPYLSIDYTGEKGKVYSIMERTGLLKYSETYSDFSAVSAAQKMQEIVSKRAEIRTTLLMETSRLEMELEEVYRQMWGEA